MSLTRLFLCTTILVSGSFSFAKRSCTDEEFAKAISKDLPEGSASIIKRIVECNHWGGEVGDTSPERTKEIEAAVAKAKCNSLADDQATFIKRHAKIKKVQEAFFKADAWDGQCD